MGKKTKVGKQRKDKYYHLAKETGYRSRASFKLVQLNRKFEFLQKSQVVVDLCAAPGGWAQVASEYCPISTIIIAVDLVSIKPIRNVITLQNDITTDSCKSAIKAELKDWLADCVLNDGAPNVGQNWIQDAFSQAQLTLSALKLASEVLKKGGWFVTKVFRSKDYAALITVFRELFRKVHVTKPQASRNESAEIFVVCQGFKRPAKLDPKLLDPKSVFKDLNLEPEKPRLNLFHPEKQKKSKAVGYEEGNYSVYRQLSASEFVESERFLELLGQCNSIKLDEELFRNHKATTPEVIECLKDVQVLGRKELRDVLNWRKKMRQQMFALAKASETPDEEQQGDSSKGDEKIDEISPEEQIDQEIDQDIQKALDEAELELKTKSKKQKRKELKEKRKRRNQIDLKMVIPGDKPDIGEEDLFSLSNINKARERATEERDEEPETMHDEEEDEVDLTEADLATADAIPNDLIVYEDDKPTRTKKRADLWFSRESFKDLITEEDEDEEIERVLALRQQNNNSKKDAEDEENEMEDSKDFNSESNFVEDIELSDDEPEEPEPLTVSDQKPDVKNDEIEVAPAPMYDPDDDQGLTKKQKKKRVKLDPETLALGSMLIHSSKSKRELIEFGFNRYVNNDDQLPDWFIEDEKKHYRPQLPVTKELVDEYRARQREIDARPIKKVAEAKARKKKKVIRKMEKIKKKAEALVENPDLSEHEKSKEMRKIYGKAKKSKKDSEITYVVAKKGGGKRVRRPAGVQGRFKVVDPRMKKDLRAQKAKLKTQGRGKKTARKGKTKAARPSAASGRGGKRKH